ncbi:MAG: three-Cys-motif partner protein TcmP [Paludisphaera borealis]|uniref:three-Cys-motif partner protein TcmP n=1 Tax=Paludisphaera borealis TaxID=1387353 RepID=UPI0028466EF6|nr:three-Cys-motif partner protein TcmP [Paludisphaera borealis]MDR3622984.1 three-Cys-motif partner protein TcmP [Paludisphaera borealis]
MSENFFDEQTEQSEVKATLVAKYFPAYMGVIGNAQKRYGGDRIAYIDLFAGPGRYKDGATSTPVKIIEQAIANEDMRQRLVAIFNDKDEDNVRSLQTTLEALPGYDQLKRRPHIQHGEVGDEIVKRFEENKLIPTLFFVDPWGYKGMTLRLINSVLKDWGCDCFFFFNYSRVSAGLANDLVEKHMDALFGRERAESLRKRFEDKVLRPVEREAFIVEEMCQALKDMGGEFVLPFRFHNKKGTRITHHLFFVSKNFRGYAIMKEIMHAHATGKHDGTVNFEYNPADVRQPMIYGLLRPVDELGEMLMKDFAGDTHGITEIYEKHSVGTPYVLKDYREQLCKLEREGKIIVDKPCPPRPKNTMAPQHKITFPKR